MVETAGGERYERGPAIENCGSEAQVALGAFFDFSPNLRLADPDAPPQWRSLPFFRGLQRLDARA